MARINEAPTDGTLVLSGNAAMGRGALEAGVRVVTSYPGSPSTQLTESLIQVAHAEGIYAEWSANEKVAFEMALGASMVGVRSLVSMKNAGLNLIMDPLILATYTGIRGGLVINIADDPGAHVSATEQDSRGIARYLDLPCFEPATPQEALDMTRDAFAVSEELELPVFVKSLNKVVYTARPVTVGTIVKHDVPATFNAHFKRPYRWMVYAYPRPTADHRWLLETVPRQQRIAERPAFNALRLMRADIGIITAGIASAYVEEVLVTDGLRDTVSVLKIGCVTPIPQQQVIALLAQSKTVLVVEESEPVVEDQVRTLAQEHQLPCAIVGKRFRKVFERYGELSTAIVRAGIAQQLGRTIPHDAARAAMKAEVAKLIVPHTHTFCAGCPHLGTHQAIKLALWGEQVRIVNGDVGCYELAGFGLETEKTRANDSTDNEYYPPRAVSEQIDTIYCMGSGVSIAQGQVRAGYTGKVVALIGDSTFFHAGIPALANAVHNKTKLMLVVFDNRWTAMTGHHPHPGSPTGTDKQEAPEIRIEKVAEALGAGFVRVVDAYEYTQNVAVMKEALAYDGVAVVVSKRECALTVERERVRGEGRKPAKTQVAAEKCTGCKMCLKIGCPAIHFDASGRKATIDPDLCVDCGMCVNACPISVITTAKTL